MNKSREELREYIASTLALRNPSYIGNSRIIVECDGKSDASYGMSLSTFAEYIAELFPDCRLAYNLDGGGSTNVIFNNKRIHRNPDLRKISDILYFASAHDAQ